MAALSTPIRQQIWRGLMRYWSRRIETITGLTKVDIQAAVNSADDWADANASAYNTALPVAFRTNASASQKALVLALVILARYDPALLTSLVGEVN